MSLERPRARACHKRGTSTNAPATAVRDVPLRLEDLLSNPSVENSSRRLHAKSRVKVALLHPDGIHVDS